MEPINKIYCKIVFRSSNSEDFENIIGEIDKKQLISSDSNWITVYNSISTSKGLKAVFSVVPKSEIKDLIVLKQIKRIVFAKLDLALNNTIELR